MTFDQIIADLKNKVYHPVYFLTGEEAYYIDKISDYIESNVLNETEKEFNQTVLYGEETNLSAIVSYAKRYPMMANYQVVIVKEAQRVEGIEGNIKNQKEDSDEKENQASSKKSPYHAYIENPLKSTILVICLKYKKLDKRKSFAKLVEKKGVLFESTKLYENKIPQWINEYVKERGYKISTKSSAILSEYLGNDLSKIVNEIEKIIISIPDKSEITHQQIYDNIGISKDFNIFELQNAIGKKDVLKANQIINHFAANLKENPLIKNITILYSFFNKLLIYNSIDEKQKNDIASALSINPYFVNEYATAAKNYSTQKVINIISHLREYDLKAKGVDATGSIEEGELYKELLYKILH